jgi:hypothetical protein
MKAISLLTLAIVGLLSTSLRAEDAAKLTVGEFTFTVAKPWTTGQNSGMMTKAILNYPVEGGAPLEAKFYDFGSQSGGVEANVTRWISQFDGKPEVKREEIEIGGTKVVLVTATGTYLDGGPMSPTKTPRPDYTLLGAIVVGKESSVFIKLTGPKAAAAAAQESFKTLATSPFAK